MEDNPQFKVGLLTEKYNGYRKMTGGEFMENGGKEHYYILIVWMMDGPSLMTL